MRDLRGSPRTLAAASATLEARADRANALQARLIAVRRLLLLGRLDEARPPWPASTCAGCHRRCWRWPSWPRPRWRCARCAQHQRARRSPAPTRRPNARACPRCWPRSPRRAPCSIIPPPGASTLARAAAAPRRGRSAPRLGRAGGRRLPSRPARRRHLAAAGAPAGAVRVGALARRGLARRRRSAHPDRARVRRPPPQRVAPGAPARRDRPFARARRAAGAHRGQRARLRAHAARRARCRPPGGAHRWRSGVAPGAARRRAAWSTSALALALGASQRTVQRALVELEAAGRVRSIGRARAQRWLSPPLAGFTTILLLPAALPLG